MQVSDFHFDLPDELIARYPMAERTASRLLQLDGQTGALRHGHFVDVLDQLNPGDLLVFNNTRVIPARMFGQKASGGKLEVLVERILDEHSVLAHVRSSKSPNQVPASLLDGGADGVPVEAEMRARHDALFEIHFLDPRPVLTILDAIGHMPLPPISTVPTRMPTRSATRPSTTRSRVPWRRRPPVCTSTSRCSSRSVPGRGDGLRDPARGAGTFQPVRVDKIEDHHMHSEYAEVPQEVVDAIAATRARGGRVVAVGTTSVRSSRVRPRRPWPRASRWRPSSMTPTSSSSPVTSSRWSMP